jgi:hypothetical protein
MPVVADCCYYPSYIPLSLDGVSFFPDTAYCAASIRISGFFLPVAYLLTISKRMELRSFGIFCDGFHIAGGNAYFLLFFCLTRILEIAIPDIGLY